MIESKLFQYAVIWNPTKEQAEAGKKSELLVEINTILAPSQEKAGILAARAIPEDKLDEIDQIQIVVRPF